MRYMRAVAICVIYAVMVYYVVTLLYMNRNVCNIAAVCCFISTLRHMDILRISCHMYRVRVSHLCYG